MTILKKLRVSMIEDYLMLCESEIEKYFLLNVLNYLYDLQFIAGENRKSFLESFHSEPIIDFELEFDAPHLIELGYRRHRAHPFLYKLKGIEFSFSWEELPDPFGLGINKTEEKSQKRIWKLLPQYQVADNIRVDFAFLGSKFENEKFIGETKIAVECDGFGYHRQPAQLTRDNQRARVLSGLGWILFRFSGQEIHGLNNFKDIQQWMENILNLAEVSKR